MPRPDHAGTECLIHDLEREDREHRQRIVAMMADEGREDLIADFQQKMRDVDTGVYHARMLWRSISSAQRAALEKLGEVGGTSFRDRSGLSNWYCVKLKVIGAVTRLCLPATMRKLAAHGLVDWNGGAFDPEAEAVLSEQGRFVLAKGRSELQA